MSIRHWFCDHDESETKVLSVAKPQDVESMRGGSAHLARVIVQGATTYRLTCVKCGRKRIVEVYGMPLEEKKTPPA
jgi:hypothetical protein